MTNYNLAPNKKAKVTLETTSLKQSRSDLNVAFSTADRETAILEFTVTQDNRPLILGEDNIETSITYIHSNGLSVKENLDITDGLNGKISTLVPESISAIPGKVTAQVYVARKQKDHENYQAVVAERIISFEIEKSLAWAFSGETKLNYIIEFDELKASLRQRVYEIEEAMANLEDYVSKVEQARDKGISDIEIAKTSSLNELKSLASKRLEEINTKGTDYSTKLTEIRDSIDGKVEKFNEDVKAGGYVKDKATEKWQKYKITQDNGDAIELKTGLDLSDTEVLNSFKPGNYFLPLPMNGPGDSDSGFLNVQSRSNGTIKRLAFSPRKSDKTYVRRFLENWTEWIDITEDMETKSSAQRKITEALDEAKAYTDELLSDTGWQDLPLMSGVEADTGTGSCKYRVKNGICTIIFNVKMAVSQSEIPFLTLPKEVLPKYNFSFLARTNGYSGKNPVKCSYEDKEKHFKIWQNNDNTINTGDYVYGYLTYIVG